MAVSPPDKIGGLWLVYGIPGTGKTLLGGLEDGLISAVSRGRRVYTNITGLSIAGISAVAGVPPLCVDVHTLETIEDIIKAFDSDDCAGVLFILDEMKQVLARDERADSWLCQRLNIMRKRGNDFIMIAQVPSYFSTEVRSLARGCSEFVRLYSFGSSSKTREYRYNSGTPRIVSGKRQADGIRIRTLSPELFTCYDSYIDSQIKGNENSGRAVSVWKSPKAIIAYLFIFSVLCLLGFAVYMFFNIKDSFGALGAQISGRPVAVSDSSKVVNNAILSSSSAGAFVTCYSYIICDEEYCKTSLGLVPASSYRPDLGGVVTPSGILSLCGDN